MGLCVRRKVVAEGSSSKNVLQWGGRVRLQLKRYARRPAGRSSRLELTELVHQLVEGSIRGVEGGAVPEFHA